MKRTTEQVRRDLDALIAGMCAGLLPLADFEKQFSAALFDEISADGLTDAESEFYGAVIERTDSSSAAPTAEDRAYGWMDVKEFRVWLAAFNARFPPDFGFRSSIEG